jgi:polyisoprenyl-teichoic acid--peptidoglycan teichoic acid transferase
VRRAVAAGVPAVLLGWIAAGAVAIGPPLAAGSSAELGRTMEAEFNPALPSDHLLFVLAIGSDARPRQAVTRSRADSLHLIGIDPRRGTASILGIPRDSYVPIPGAGTQKINASLFNGGPELTVRTVEQLTGIRVDAYLLTGFEDFRQMVNEVGNLEIRVPYPMSDPFSGAHFRPGPTRLSGPEALSFARDRHDVPGGDFGRSMNQGRLLIAALREFADDMRKDPVALLRWAAAGARHIRSDLTVLDMFELLLAALSVDPARVNNRVVGGSGATIGGQSVVRLGSAAQALFRDLRQDARIGS